MGWLMREGKKIKQVRLKSGGGTRHLSFYSDDTIEVVKKKLQMFSFLMDIHFIMGKLINSMFQSLILTLKNWITT